MTLNDFLLKAKINMAYALDSRVSMLDIGVTVDEAQVTLAGDVDSEAECAAAEEITRSVEGVLHVRNLLTCGIGKGEDTADLVRQRLLEKLEEEWQNLPDQTALVQADYLRWALWMIYKFRLPTEGVAEANRRELELAATEQALEQVAGYVNAPKAMLALWMQQQAQAVAQSAEVNAPVTQAASLVTTPVAAPAGAI